MVAEIVPQQLRDGERICREAPKAIRYGTLLLQMRCGRTGA